MSTPAKPTKADRKAQAREDRLAREREEAAAAARKRRHGILGGVLALAAVVVVVAIIISGGSSSSTGVAKKQPGESVPGQKDVASMLAGIPQTDRTLGDPKAPVTVVEFADLQCPVCKDFSNTYFPPIVRDFVKTGKVKVEFRNLTFIDDNVGGTGSLQAAHVAAAAGMQNKLWNFVELFYKNQGEEGSGYITDAFMKNIAGGVAGLSWSQVLAHRDDAAVTQQLGEANTAFSRYGGTGTPTFLLGTSAANLKKFGGSYTDLSKAITAELQKAGVAA
jgi:protein-disulfide isomerase